MTSFVPYELWIKIFQNVEMDDRLALESVCRTFNTISKMTKIDTSVSKIYPGTILCTKFLMPKFYRVIKGGYKKLEIQRLKNTIVKKRTLWSTVDSFQQFWYFPSNENLETTANCIKLCSCRECKDLDLWSTSFKDECCIYNKDRVCLQMWSGCAVIQNRFQQGRGQYRYNLRSRRRY